MLQSDNPYPRPRSSGVCRNSACAKNRGSAPSTSTMFRPERTHVDHPNKNARVRRAVAFVKWYSDFQSCESLYGAGPGLVYRLTQARENCHSMLRPLVLGSNPSGPTISLE